LALVISPFATQYFSDACAGEVSSVVAQGVIATVAGLWLLIKRYKRGGITPLGSRI
jgi:hypothetical protein